MSLNANVLVALKALGLNANQALEAATSVEVLEAAGFSEQEALQAAVRKVLGGGVASPTQQAVVVAKAKKVAVSTFATKQTSGEACRLCGNPLGTSSCCALSCDGRTLRHADTYGIPVGPARVAFRKALYVGVGRCYKDDIVPVVVEQIRSEFPANPVKSE